MHLPRHEHSGRMSSARPVHRRHRRCDLEGLAGVSEVSLAGWDSEQAIAADALKSPRQDVKQEAANELVSASVMTAAGRLCGDSPCSGM